MLRIILIAVVALAAAAMAYVRLAPSDPARWHVMPAMDGPGDFPGAGSFRAARQLTVPASDVLAAVEQRILATPRTQLLAGSVAEGMLTFVTRSRVMGFPDYTTVVARDDLLVIHGRLRFGKADFGVNRARVLEWLDSLGPLTVPL